MAAWLIVATERLPARVRRFSVAAASTLTLAGAIVALTLLAGSGSVARRRLPTPAAAPHEKSERSVSRSVGAPVSASGLQPASFVSGRFLATYLPFAYGRASVGSLAAITSGLRRQLLGVRVRATPVERRRQARVLSLRLVGTTPGFIVATASVDDGGISAYRLRFTLEQNKGRWLVDSVQAG